MNKLFIAFVCTVAALGGLLFGYDTAVISGAIGYMSRQAFCWDAQWGPGVRA
jgi:SP family arabinose:H+ symporter-like MFS transporter